MKKSSMKILMSGATGFIGKNLSDRLIRDGHIIHAIVRPSTDTQSLDKGMKAFVYDGNPESLNAYMKAESFDGVIHLAALYLASHSPSDIPKLIESNLLFGTSLLDAASKTGVPWFINTSTQAQHYGNKQYSPLNLYAATKQAFEDLAKYYSEATDIDFITIELFETFGPHDKRPKVLNLWLKAIKTGQSMDFPPGKQIIDMCHIDDVVEAYIKLMGLASLDKKRKLNGKKFSLVTMNRPTLRELAKIFEKATGGKLNINWGAKDYKQREIMRPWHKGTKLPGWKPKVGLEEGIKKMNE